MSEWAVWGRLLQGLLLPPGVVLVALVASLLWWQRRPRLAKALAVLGVALLWLGSTPWVAQAYERLLTDGFGTLDLKRARSAQAIVIPAAGLQRAAEDDVRALSRLTLERVRYAARLAKRTGLPILVTGGHGQAPNTQAEFMQAVLVGVYGVPVRWAEDRSANLREQAAESGRLLRPRDADGLRRIVVVAHGFAMRRTVQEFEAVGFEVLPAPTRLGSLALRSISDVLPSVSALERTRDVSAELVASAASALFAD